MKSFILAARPKTLPAAIVPVWVGCALTFYLTGSWDVRLAFFTVMASVWIQIATNFFNDAIDSEKGADTEARLGPVRATASGQLTQKTVYFSAVLCLLLAAVFALPLVIERGVPVLLIGLPSFYLAYGYTGGPFPLAYKGLGELFVILFFGIVAITGTVFVQTGKWFTEALFVGLAIGCLSAVLISINNLRDVDEDRSNHKNTLAVKWGRRSVIMLLQLMSMIPYLLMLLLFPIDGRLLYFLPPMLLGASIIRKVNNHPPGIIYNRYLALAALQLVFFAIAFTLITCL